MPIRPSLDHLQPVTIECQGFVKHLFTPRCNSETSAPKRIEDRNSWYHPSHGRLTPAYDLAGTAGYIPGEASAPRSVRRPCSLRGESMRILVISLIVLGVASMPDNRPPGPQALCSLVPLASQRRVPQFPPSHRQERSALDRLGTSASTLEVITIFFGALPAGAMSNHPQAAHGHLAFNEGSSALAPLSALLTTGAAGTH